MAKQSYSPEVRAQIIVEALAGDKSIAAVARKHGVPQNTVHRWVALAKKKPAKKVRKLMVPEIRVLLLGKIRETGAISYADAYKIPNASKARIATAIKAMIDDKTIEAFTWDGADAYRLTLAEIGKDVKTGATPAPTLRRTVAAAVETAVEAAKSHLDIRRAILSEIGTLGCISMTDAHSIEAGIGAIDAELEAMCKAKIIEKFHRNGKTRRWFRMYGSSAGGVPSTVLAAVPAEIPTLPLPPEPDAMTNTAPGFTSHARRAAEILADDIRLHLDPRQAKLDALNLFLIASGEQPVTVPFDASAK